MATKRPFMQMDWRASESDAACLTNLDAQRHWKKSKRSVTNTDSNLRTYKLPPLNSLNIHEKGIQTGASD